MSGARPRVLIVGGYGTFGGRLAELLADEAALTLVVAGRSRARAEAFCRSLTAQATLEPAAFDRDGDLDAQLKEARPDVVVDATGPFQAYGAQPYRLVEACIRQGRHYLDLADASAFVAGVSRLDAAARARGVAALSGVSSFPVLTAAVVRELAADMAEVREIRGGIAPSPYAGVGLNVIRAIASYAGKPVGAADGSTPAGWGLTSSMRYVVRPPGALPLASTRFSLVDVPDLVVLPQLWPGLQAVWMGAGPRPELLHLALNGLAWLVRIGLIPTLVPLSPLFHWASNTIRWGEHRGGMFVQVRGLDAEGHALERSWHMTAEADDGPMIPSMAAEAMIRRLLAERPPAAGARPAVGDLSLADYDALFARRAIRTGVRAPADPAWPLYRRLLGSAWDRLPDPVRRLHDLHGELTATGRAEVSRGRGVLAGLAARLFGFPPSGADVPLTVSFRAGPEGEVWRRRFGEGCFLSVQSEGRGRSEGLLSERFGPVAVDMALVLEGERLRLVVRRWRLFGIALPLWLAPKGEAFETAEAGRFRFDVSIGHPLTGLIVAYRGWLEPETKST